MFPTSFDGKIKVASLESTRIDAVLTRIEQELNAARATNVARNGNKITFRGGVSRQVWNWNVLVPVHYGEIEVLPGSPGVVRYKFSCVEMLVLTTVMVGVLSIFAFSFTIFVIGWLWLFGMNYLIGAVRLPAFVRRAVGG